MNERFIKVVVGLALKNDIYNGRLNKKLIQLYSIPNIHSIEAVYTQLITSDKHIDREVAFWLELALQRKADNVSLHELITTTRKMEVLLFDLLWRVNPDSQRDLNNWLNYITNVPQCLQNGYELDAKILLSLALHSSKKRSIERIKKK